MLDYWHQLANLSIKNGKTFCLKLEQAFFCKFLCLATFGTFLEKFWTDAVAILNQQLPSLRKKKKWANLPTGELPKNEVEEAGTAKRVWLVCTLPPSLPILTSWLSKFFFLLDITHKPPSPPPHTPAIVTYQERKEPKPDTHVYPCHVFWRNHNFFRQFYSNLVFKNRAFFWHSLPPPLSLSRFVTAKQNGGGGGGGGVKHPPPPVNSGFFPCIFFRLLVTAIFFLDKETLLEFSHQQMEEWIVIAEGEGGAFR